MKKVLNWDNPTTLQATIIKRALGEDSYKSFLQEYKNARNRSSRSRSVTPVDRKILKDWKNGIAISELRSK